MALVNRIRFPGKRRLSCVTRSLGILLALAPLAALAAEPLEYYGFDEATQSASPERSGKFADVALDGFGGALALAIADALRHRRFR